VEFRHLVGMVYVSCSPFRVPIARLAAAQAYLQHPRKKKEWFVVRGSWFERITAGTRDRKRCHPDPERSEGEGSRGA
jgi:hypothetical protein